MSTQQRPRDDFERALVQALRNEAYSAPLRLTATALEERAARRHRAAMPGLRPLLGIAVLVGAVVLVVLASPRLPGAVGPSTSSGCAVSTVTRHGSWWAELGGDRAFFNADSTGMYAGDDHYWLIHVRFHPDAGATTSVSVWAEPVDGGGRVDGRLNGPADPSNIYRGDVHAPDLPGGWYLFEQPFPAGGCWRLVAAIDGEVAGTAVVQVADAAEPTPTPDRSAPTPRLPPESEPPGPSPTFPAGGPQRWGYLAEADPGLDVHVRPDLASSVQDEGVTYFYVVGEQVHDGVTWQRVEYWHHRAEMVFGWLAATRDQLVATEQVCYEPTLATLPDGDPARMGECYAGQTLELGPVVIRPLDDQPVVHGEPAWLATGCRDGDHAV